MGRLRGHSGFKLDVQQHNGGVVFCKWSTDGDTTRLFHQRDKQIRYKVIIDSDPVLSTMFYVPKVITSNKKGFCMEYVYGRHLLDVISECNISILNNIMDNVFYWVEWAIEHGSNVPFLPSFFEPKLETITDVNELKNIFVKLLKSAKGLPTPVGYCHGDFTLSNMLYLENGKLGLVDWHDSFFESPLQDVCKLFQEMILKWSMQMSNDYCIKFDVAYKHLFNRYNQWVDSLDVNPKLVRVFDAMVLLRLFPYTKDKFLRGLIYEKYLEVIKR